MYIRFTSDNYGGGGVSDLMAFPRVMLPKKRHLISGRLGVTNCGGVRMDE